MNKQQKLIDTNMMRAYYVQAQLLSHKHKTKKPQPFVRYLIIILLISALCSCSKEVSKPKELSLPNRPEVMTVTAIKNTITYGYRAWQFNFTIPQKAENDIKIWYEWKQSNSSIIWTFEHTLLKGDIQRNVATMIDVLGDIQYIRLVKVEGTDRKFNLLHVK